jgi:D-alanyl-D-alanine carboxypeptidase/D-alanyl-D-alanine-endopeptidase (penicillin-binding protein 4)
MRIKINIAICFLLLGFASCTAHKKLMKMPQPVGNTATNEKVVVENKIEQYAATYLLNDSNLLSAHVGISVYDPTEKKYLYNYQGNKYFIPASNTKLLTCYAAMKYLGDSLVGLRYDIVNDTSISIRPAADPTFLISDFSNQPVYSFLKKFKNIEISPRVQNFRYQGKGWAWDDYRESYAALRGEFPIYGNLATFELAKDSTIKVIPKIFELHAFTKQRLSTC